MRYLIVLLITFNFQTLSFGCVCEPIDSTNVGNWINEADFVVEGEYLTNINPNIELRNRRNEQNLGYDILFKVTSVIKGTISTDTIALIQFDSGSCTETFEHGEKYIILGRSIKEFICKDDEQSIVELDSLGDYPPKEVPPPPSYVDEQGVVRYYNCDNEESEYWNTIAMTYATSYISHCTTFDANSQSGKLIKRN